MVNKPDLGWRVILRKLSRELPEELVKQRKQGTAMLDYIEWSTAADILDDIVPEWQQYIKDVKIVGDRVAVTVSITVDGITRENIGFEELDTSSYGDPFSNAFAMAFKRCAAMFGVGRHLYKGPEYEPFRLATNEQLEQVVALMESGQIPAEYHDAINEYIDSGGFEQARALKAIAEYSKAKPAAKKRAPSKAKAKPEAEAKEKEVPVEEKAA